MSEENEKRTCDNLTGRMVGHLQVLTRVGEYRGEPYWQCLCSCGRECFVLHSLLEEEQTLDCGCVSKRQRKNITGQRFGRLTAEQYLFDNRRKQACWLFRCDCGNTKVLPVNSVRSNNIRSCGCLRAEKTRQIHLTDISRKRFGRLTAVRPTEKRDSSGSVIWECQCDCGNTCLASVAVLKRGNVRSCGCYYHDSRSQCDQYRKDKIDDTNLSKLVSSKELRADNRSGSTGVYYLERLGKWEAYISFRKKRYHLGVFSSKDDAVKARSRAEETLHDPMIMENIDLLTDSAREKFQHYMREG